MVDLPLPHPEGLWRGEMTTANDAAAYKLIYDSRADRLKNASTRAEKWIAGLTALVTILTTAMVVKGPENFAKAEGTVRGAVLALVVAGGVGLSAGILCAYTAAFGGLFGKSEVDKLLETPPTVVTSASQQLESAVTADASTSRTFMRAALLTTSLGMVALTAAIAFSWFATPKKADDTTTCARIDGETVVFEDDLSIKSGTVAIIECPNE
jgi:hypothetical protein